MIIFFPIFWMTITAFKTERGAYSPDLIFMPTLESFKDVFARSNYLAFVMNSIYVSIGSTLVCFLFAIPAAYKMSFFPTLKTQSRLLWMLSTKMMPAVGVLVPIYLLFKQFGLLDNVFGLDHYLHPDESSRSRSGCPTPTSAKFRRRFWKRAGSTGPPSGKRFGTFCAQ